MSSQPDGEGVPMMKQGLSKREKALLLAVGLLIMVYLAVQFAILPLADRYIEARQTRDFLTEELHTVEMDIASKPAIIESHTAAGERYEELKLEYPTLVPDEEIDALLTDLLLSHNLQPRRLNWTMPKAPQSGEGESTSSVFTIVSATVHIYGSFNSLLQLLDEVDSMQHARITNLNYTMHNQQDNTNLSSMTIDFELMFIAP
jgi:hypothetical protein